MSGQRKPVLLTDEEIAHGDTVWVKGVVIRVDGSAAAEEPYQVRFAGAEHDVWFVPYIVRKAANPQPWVSVDDAGNPVRMVPAMWEAVPDSDGMVVGGDQGWFYPGEDDDHPDDAVPYYMAVPLDQDSQP